MRSVPASRFARALVVAAVAALPFALVAAGAGAAADAASRRAATALLRLSDGLNARASADLAFEAERLDLSAAPPVVPAATQPARSPGKPGGKTPHRAAPAAVFVPAARVLELARGSARPRGVFVVETALHPAGLRLSGVAALGLGLQDGDILVEALGVAPKSPGQVVGAVIEARAKQTRYLSGTLWRAGQTFRITVEQPYLEPAAARSALGAVPS